MTRTSVVTLALLAIFASAPATATLLYTVDTSSVIGTPGYIDIQFNPGDPTSQVASVAILDFDMDGGSLNSALIETSGSFSGTLPGALSATNNTPFNDYFEPIVFGSTITFVINLSGPAIDSPNGTSVTGSTFGLGFYDANMNSILTNDISGFVAETNLNLDGSITTILFPDALGGPSVVTIGGQAPEPSTFGLIAAALGILLLAKKILPLS